MSKSNPIIRSKRKKAETLFRENRLAEAKVVYAQLCQLDRSDADAWFTLGLLNGQLGLLEEVISCCREAIALRPDFAEAHYNLAKALQGLGRLEAAEQSYRHASRLNPHWPEALNNLGNVIQELGRHEEAIECYRSALNIRADYAEALLNLGNVLLLRGNTNAAVNNYRHVLQLRPGNITAQKGLGSALALLGDLDGAMACYQEAGRLHPSDLGVTAAEAALLERQGKLEQAYRSLLPYLDKAAGNLEIANAFGGVCEKIGRYTDAITLLESGLTHDKRSGRQRRVTAHFNLGRLYERNAEYDKAFAHYQAGNDLKAHVFDRKAYGKFIDDVIAVFSPEFLRGAPRARHGSDRPVFIIGIPRSGTSLIEQILASHPQVYGAGELEDLCVAVNSIGAATATTLPYPYCIPKLTEELCDRLAGRYLNRLAELSTEARLVTDKMPENFLYLGVIALLFPEARIIHCSRDALDTCLSCYSCDFAGFHPYMYKLEDLGFYYRHYVKLMRHWHQVLSLPVLNVSYEALVADQEGMIRRVVAFCGLPWDERCLRYYENDRFVNTLSYDQVRRPIYTSSIGRWRRFATHLEPLRKALAES